MRFAPIMGFTEDTIARACIELQLQPTLASLLPRGPIELIEHAMEVWLTQTKETIAVSPEFAADSSASVREKLHFGLKTRLLYEVPFLDTWPQAMAIGLHKANALATA